MGGFITFKHTGNFSKTLSFFNKIINKDYRNILDKYGKKGVDALAEATPRDSGITAESWTYEIIENRNGTFTISWFNTNNVENSRGYSFNIAVLIEYGHATKDGTWVSARPFVQRAMDPVLDKLVEELTEELGK